MPSSHSTSTGRDGGGLGAAIAPAVSSSSSCPGRTATAATAGAAPEDRWKATPVKEGAGCPNCCRDGGGRAPPMAGWEGPGPPPSSSS